MISHSTKLDPAWQVERRTGVSPFLSFFRPAAPGALPPVGEVELERERGGPCCCRAPANLGAGAARWTRGGGGWRASAPSRPFGPRPGGRERRPHASPAAPLAALPPARLPDPHLPRSSVTCPRSARTPSPPVRLSPLPGPPWCSDDAPGEPLRPLPRLLAPAGPPPPGPRPRQVSAGLGGRRRRSERLASPRQPAPGAPLVGRYGVAAAPADAAGFPQPGSSGAESGNLSCELLVPAAWLLEVCRGSGSWWR